MSHVCHLPLTKGVRCTWHACIRSAARSCVLLSSTAVIRCRHPLPSSTAVLRCHHPPPLSAAIAVIVRRHCLPLPPSLPQSSSPLRCLRRLSPPTLVLPRHSPPLYLASRCHRPPSLSATVVVCRRHCCPPNAVFHRCSHHRHSAVSGVSCHHRPFLIVVHHRILRAFVVHCRPLLQLSSLPLPLLVDCCLCPPPSLSPPLSLSLPLPSLFVDATSSSAGHLVPEYDFVI
jgi:hypothetical protein